MKKTVAVFMALVVMVSTLHAGGVKEEKRTAELVIGTPVDINSLDLQTQQDQVNNIVLKTTHQTLVRFSPEGKIEPALATDWEQEDDTHILFHLDKRACFSDGSPLTASDVKFTMDRAQQSYVAGNLQGLLSTKVIDEHTVEMETEGFHNDFLLAFANVPVSILSKKAYESGMEKPYLVGSGPYTFDSWKPGSYVKVVRNPHAWGDKKAGTDAIIFKVNANGKNRVVALQTGELDVCVDPPLSEVRYLENDKNIVVHQQPGSRLFYLGFNVSRSPWDNQTLRQAVASAIDRKSVVLSAVDGKGTTQTTVLNRGLWGFSDTMPGFPYDQEKAKALLDKAGYASGLSTTLLIPSGDNYQDAAEVIKANLEAIGVNVKIEAVDDATLKERCSSGDVDLFLWRWNEDTMVDFVYRDLFFTGSESNYFHYSDPTVDALIDQVATEKDQDKRREAGVALQEYLVNACPEVPLCTADLVIAYKKGLCGECLYGGGNHDWSQAYVKL